MSHLEPLAPELLDKLTEVYKIENINGQIKFSFEDLNFKVIDFSQQNNIPLLIPYSLKRQEFIRISSEVFKWLDKNKDIKNPEEEIPEQEGIIITNNLTLCYDILMDILTHLLEKDENLVNNLDSFHSYFISSVLSDNPRSIGEIFILWIDFIRIIDLAAQVGQRKYYNENQDKFNEFINMLKNSKTNIILPIKDEQGNIVKEIQLNSSQMEKQFKYIQEILSGADPEETRRKFQEEKKDKEIDLNKVSCINTLKC